MKNEIDAKEIPKIVKKALSEVYGFKNVSVKRGRGTAWGWVEAYVKVPKAAECICTPQQPYCSICRGVLNTANDNARKVVYEAMNKAGAEFYTYYSDDGIGEERDEFLLQVDFIR